MLHQTTKILGFIILTSLMLVMSTSRVFAADFTTEWIHATGTVACFPTTYSNTSNAIDGNDATFATASSTSPNGQNCFRWVFPDTVLPEGSEITSFDIRLLRQNSYTQGGCTLFANLFDTAGATGNTVSASSSFDGSGHGEYQYTVSSSVNNAIWSLDFEWQTGSTWWTGLGLGGGSCTSTNSKDYYEAYIQYNYSIQDASFIVLAIQELIDVVSSIPDFLVSLIVPDPEYVDELLDETTGLLDSKAPVAYALSIFNLDWSTEEDAPQPFTVTWEFGLDQELEPMVATASLPSYLSTFLANFFAFICYFFSGLYFVFRVRSLFSS